VPQGPPAGTEGGQHDSAAVGPAHDSKFLEPLDSVLCPLQVMRLHFRRKARAVRALIALCLKHPGGVRHGGELLYKLIAADGSVGHAGETLSREKERRPPSVHDRLTTDSLFVLRGGLRASVGDALCASSIQLGYGSWALSPPLGVSHCPLLHSGHGGRL
jgi:hypothetical protein